VPTPGYNVYPREVEEVLHRHPAVASVPVIGVPDAKYGEEVCAVVQPAGEAAQRAEDEMRAPTLPAGLASTWPPTSTRGPSKPASAAVAGGRDFSLWCVPGRSDTVRVTAVSVR
jgi:acyl-CoA synthetase (AMP-forming)/AMP-acid ligase II